MDRTMPFQVLANVFDLIATSRGGSDAMPKTAPKKQTTP
jgi:hypothetical protein